MLQTLQAVGCERDSTVRQLSGQVGTDSCASSAFGLSCLILTVNVETAHTVQEPKKNSPRFWYTIRCVIRESNPGLYRGRVLFYH
jgi:hypothetical protein